MKDFADAVASIPNAQVTRIAFVLETEMEKAASILEIGKSRDYYLIPYQVGDHGALVVTDKGQELLSTLQQTGILENSDFRIQISAPLQIVDKNLFLKANGFLPPKTGYLFLKFVLEYLPIKPNPMPKVWCIWDLKKTIKKQG